MINELAARFLVNLHCSVQTGLATCNAYLTIAGVEMLNVDRKTCDILHLTYFNYVNIMKATCHSAQCGWSFDCYFKA